MGTAEKESAREREATGAIAAAHRLRSRLRDRGLRMQPDLLFGACRGGALGSRTLLSSNQRRAEYAMQDDHVYKIIELAGTSKVSIYLVLSGCCA